MDTSPGNVTSLLNKLADGDQQAGAQLVPLVYNELRRLAARCLQRERENHTLQATALVHEAYLKLTAQRSARWQNRAQFFALAAQAMRRILVDYARRRSRVKRDASIVSLDGAAAAGGLRNPEEILAVHLTLEQLERIDPQQGRLVELRYFAGLSMEEAAEAMELPLRSAERQWTAAKAWLRAQLAQAPPRPVTNPPRESIAPRQEGPQ